MCKVKGSKLTDFSQIENSILQVKKRNGRVSDFQRDNISDLPKWFTKYHREILKLVYALYPTNGEYTPYLSGSSGMQKNALTDLRHIGFIELTSTKYGMSVRMNTERIKEIKKIIDLNEVNALIDDYITSSTVRLGHGISITTNPHLMTKVGQTTPIVTLVENNQTENQSFACLVQIQNESGITQTLSSTTGSLASGASMSILQSWTPTASGTYNAQIFAWQDIGNPKALSTSITVTIFVK